MLVHPLGDRPVAPLVELMERCLAHILQGSEGETPRAFLEAAAADGTILIAEKEQRLVGFRAFGRVRRHPAVQQELEKALYFAQHPELEPQLRAALAADAGALGFSETTVEYFDSPFSHPGYELGVDPFFGSSLVVAPEYRRMGVATRLARESRGVLRAMGGTEMFAFVMTPNPSEQLALREGWDRVLRIGPLHANGSCRLLLGLPIEPPPR